MIDNKDLFSDNKGFDTKSIDLCVDFSKMSKEEAKADFIRAVYESLLQTDLHSGNEEDERLIDSFIGMLTYGLEVVETEKGLMFNVPDIKELESDSYV